MDVKSATAVLGAGDDDFAPILLEHADGGLIQAAEG
jgi:hypothetical protein